jgi:cytochrome c oxidase cbb3-type subunit III
VKRAVCSLIAVAACSSGAAEPDKKPGDKLEKRDAATHDANLAKLDGSGLYQALCSPCHGADAKGYKADHAPSLVNRTFLESADDDFLRISITYGRPGTSMAGYGTAAGGPLDPAQVNKVVAWLRSQGPASRPLAAEGTGDAVHGAEIYSRDCQKCHGTRSARGEGVHLANARFLSIASGAFLKHAIVNGRPGTLMEAWQGKLSGQDIDDVVAYVRHFTQADEPLAEGQLPAPTGKEPLVLNPKGKQAVFELRADPCPPGTGSACKPDARFVSADAVKAALEQGRRLVIIDARPPSDWMRAHIAGAVSIPHFDMKRLDELAKDGTWVIAYCACPHHLSGIVVDELRKRGYAHSAVLDEGVLEWHRRGYPMVVADGVKPPPKEPVK